MQKSTSIMTILVVFNTVLGFGQSGTADITLLNRCGDNDTIYFVLEDVSPPTVGTFVCFDCVPSFGIELGDTIILAGLNQASEVSVAFVSESFDVYNATPISVSYGEGVLDASLSIICGNNFTWGLGNDTVLFGIGNDTLVYSVPETDPLLSGCADTHTLPVTVGPYIPSICVVTDQDNDGHNEIVFDISGGADYNIYRGSTFLTTRLSTDNTYYEDTGVSNGEFAYTYTIEAIDVCGTSPASIGHTAIKLTTGSAPDSNTVNLTWNSYEGIVFTDEYYVIERTRGQQTDSIWGIPVVDYDQNPTSVTLSGHQAGDIYQVIVDLELTCSPQRSEAPAIRSNLLNPNATGIEDAEAIRVMLPNPSDGLHLQSDRALDVTVTDINGRLIASHQGVVVVNERYMSGMYFVNLTDGVHVVTKRLVVTQ